MDVNKHICLDTIEHYELYDFLNRNDITYIQTGIQTGRLVVFDILESNVCWPEIKKLIHEKEGIVVISNTLFSNEELFGAEWLRVRSKWHNGYPQPENNHAYMKGITYVSEESCKKCGTGVRQIDSFRILKQPKWGHKYFFMLNWIYDEFFVSNNCRSIIERSDITGVQFREVKNKKGEKVFEDVWQMEIPFVLSGGIVPRAPAIDEIYECPYCGIPKYHTCGIGSLTYKKEVFEGAPDFVKTSEVFGWGTYAPQIIITSQKVHSFLKEHKMDKNLEFEPIVLI